jgi:hypothetical protein
MGLLFIPPELKESSGKETCSGNVGYTCLTNDAISKRTASRLTDFLNDKLIYPYPFDDTDDTSFIPLTELNRPSSFEVTSCSITLADASDQ